jgi:hypothetical protein
MHFARDRRGNIASLSRRSAALAVITAALIALSGAPARAADDQTTTALSNPPSLVYGQTTALTATVTDTTNSNTIPTGSLQFTIDNAPVGGPVALIGGAASVTTPTLGAGSHTVRATYLPDTGFATNPGDTKTLTVAKATTTTVLRISPDQTGVAGQDLTASLTVAATASAPSKPSGSVSIAMNGAPMFPVPLSNGTAGLVIELPAMTATITASYQGDANFAPSQGVTNLRVSKAGTVIALSASPNPAAVNQRVTFAVTLNSVDISNWWPVGTLSGTIDGTAVPGSVALDGSGIGQASFGASFPVGGVHHVTAHFAGDENFLDADAALDETVQGPSTVSPTIKPVAARGLNLTVTPKRDRVAPYKFAAGGALLLPATVDRSAACTGNVTVKAKLKGKTVATKTVPLTSACRFKASFTVRRKGTVSVTAAFAGNARITPIASRAVKVRAG